MSPCNSAAEGPFKHPLGLCGPYRIHLQPLLNAGERRVREIIYATNAIESLNASVQKAIHNKGHFPSDQAATKLIWLALRHITVNWKNPPITWHSARDQLAIQFGERLSLTE